MNARCHHNLISSFYYANWCFSHILKFMVDRSFLGLREGACVFRNCLKIYDLPRSLGWCPGTLGTTPGSATGCLILDKRIPQLHPHLFLHASTAWAKLGWGLIHVTVNFHYRPTNAMWAHDLCTFSGCLMEKNDKVRILYTLC